MTPPPPSEPFLFGDWFVEPDRNRLTRNGEEQTLEPRIMELLVYLAAHPDRTVPRDELLDEVWEGRAVVDAVLTRGISTIRQAVGDDPKTPRYLETVPRRGYRVLVAVSPASPMPSRATAEDEGPGGTPPPPSASAGPGDDAPTVSAEAASGSERRGRPTSRRRGGAAVVAALVLLGIGLGGRSVLHTPASGEIRGVAVFPFADASVAADGEAFALGLTDAVIGELSGLAGLRVVARTSTRRFLQDGRPLPEIAKELDVQAVLEGSVVWDGERVRIQARVVDARTEGVRWARSFERPLRDVLTLQAEVAGAVATELRGALSPRDRLRLEAPREVDPEAYLTSLVGALELGHRTPGSLRAASRHFEEAVGLDPSWAPAWAGLADALVLQAVYSAAPPESVLPRARIAAQTAVELAPDLAEAWSSLGLVRLNADWDPLAAAEAHGRAAALDPGFAGARHWRSEALTILGRHEEAVVEIEHAVALDPLSAVVHGAWGQRLAHAGRWEEALVRLRQALALADLPWIHREMSIALTRLGRDEEAGAQRLEEMKGRGVPETDLARLRERLHREGPPGFWTWQKERLAELRGRGEVVSAARLAEAAAGAGDLDEAREWIDRANEEPAELLLLLLHSPAFDPLRAEGLTPWPGPVVP